MDICDLQFFKALTQIPSVEEIWLFGSRARKDNLERSDIDLSIVCPKATPEDWRKICEIVDNADTLLSIDCIRFDTLAKNDPLHQTILQDKIVIYKKGNLMVPWKNSFRDLGQALQKLNLMIHEPIDRNSYVIDATIQRFEFSVELFWKTLKKICESEGLEVNSPRSTLQKAYSLGLIQDDKLWLDMMEDRNLTSHTYREGLAREIYSRIKLYSTIMDETYAKLLKQYPPS